MVRNYTRNTLNHWKWNDCDIDEKSWNQKNSTTNEAKLQQILDFPSLIRSSKKGTMKLTMAHF